MTTRFDFAASYRHFAGFRDRFADVMNVLGTLKFCGCESVVPVKRERTRRSPEFFGVFNEPAIIGEAVDVVVERSLRSPYTLEYRARFSVAVDLGRPHNSTIIDIHSAADQGELRA